MNARLRYPRRWFTLRALRPSSFSERKRSTLPAVTAASRSFPNGEPMMCLIAQFPVDFSPATPGLIPTFAAIVDVDSGTASFNVRLSVTPDVVDGAVLATLTKTAEGGPQLLSVAGPAFVPLTVPALIKITAANDNAEASCRIRSKTVTLRAA